MITIPESLGRDVDKAREGKLKQPLAVEEFMTPGALEQVAQQTSKAAVHAEDLVPISKAEAAARTTQHGDTLPSMPATRRVIPAPFKRPRIDCGRHGRTWQRVLPGRVEPGDMVPGVGRVETVETVTRYETVAGVPDVAVGMKVIITGAAGTELACDPSDRIQAFRPAPE
jgi:hypothetical protein